MEQTLNFANFMSIYVLDGYDGDINVEFISCMFSEMCEVGGNDWHWHLQTTPLKFGAG